MRTFNDIIGGLIVEMQFKTETELQNLPAGIAGPIRYQDWDF